MWCLEFNAGEKGNLFKLYVGTVAYKLPIQFCFGLFLNMCKKT